MLMLTPVGHWYGLGSRMESVSALKLTRLGENSKVVFGLSQSVSQRSSTQVEFVK